MKRRGRPRVSAGVVVRKTVRLPRELVVELDAEGKARGYKTFSAYVRKLLEGE